ncbi:MAG: HNH endonuclease [Alphaproteobacteria bacterium]|nr:HNH endonuclease [Alphaproteobacteria bacterium]MCW5740763.1 HNH endonuclease [Alphaproteobacteria bacterium]
MLEVVIDGVSLQSRCGLRSEIDAMARVLAALPHDTRRRLATIFCDSKACAFYDVEVQARRWADGLEQLLDDAFYRLLGGHNGIAIVERQPACDAPMPPLRFAATGAGFYASREWLTLRYDTLRRHGPRCQCCGATGPEAIIQVDHILPRRDHPELALDPGNLQVLCRPCNLGKGADDTTDWRPRMAWVEGRWRGDDEEAPLDSAC